MFDFDIVSFIPRAVMQGIPLLYGSTGEILTEKSGNLNLGIPGIMYVGGISGGHFNPAVSVGLAVGGRFPSSQLLPYILAQLVGAILAAAALYVIASGKAGADLGGFAANGYGTHSPGGYSLLSALLIEVILTGFFLIVILGATHGRAPKGFAPLAIGLCLTLIHLISIPVTNTSVNPARSTAVAVFVGDWAVLQLWLFWLAPIAGGVLGALLYRYLGQND